MSTEAPVASKVINLEPTAATQEIMEEATNLYREITSKLVSMAQAAPENQGMQRALSQSQIRLEESHGWLSTAYSVSNMDAEAATEQALGPN
jgi:hypothetical protein